MRDVVEIPINGKGSIVVACDNSGAIGMKPGDVIHVPYETVAYYSFRVAVMECMAAGAEPFTVVLQNFCGEMAWEPLKKGIDKGLNELGIESLEVTGSTETNFSLEQSAIGVTVLGMRKPSKKTIVDVTEQIDVAIIGLPLVGNEVIEEEAEIAPLSLFNKFCSIEDVVLMPVGSKGVFHELNKLFPNSAFIAGECKVDLYKSSGPSTCFIAVYPKRMKSKVVSIAGRYFNELSF